MKEDKNNIDVNAIKEKAKAKARLLKALADRGFDGEKTTAQRKLDEHLAKHKLTLGDIDSSLNDRCFKIKSIDDKTILMNVIMSINPFTKIDFVRTNIVTNLDDEDYQEVKRKFAYFQKLFRSDRDVFVMAFFKKHESFFQPDEFARKKWREKQKLNEDLESLQVEVKELNSVLFSENKKDLNEEHLNLINRLKQMTIMLPSLKSAKYFRLDKNLKQ